MRFKDSCDHLRSFDTGSRLGCNLCMHYGTISVRSHEPHSLNILVARLDCGERPRS